LNRFDFWQGRRGRYLRVNTAFDSADELAPFGVSGGGVMSDKADVEAIMGALEKYAECCRRGDFETWISLWADRGVQMPPDAPARVGKEAIRGAMEPAFGAMTLDLDILRVDNAEIHGDLGLTRCCCKLTLVPKAGGEPIEAVPQGKALTLYDRQPDGSWKISYDCFNSDVGPQ